jgi:hypothetical protein
VRARPSQSVGRRGTPCPRPAYPRALEQLTRLADELEHTHPGAAGSLREGMDETLTVIKLRIRGKLRRTLESTNPWSR